MAGPISLTRRGIPPQASGIPRSTSGIENTAVSPAKRRSQAAASTTAPPTQYPWMRATVTASMRWIASAINLPASAPARRCSVPGSSAVKAETSAPALKERPFPLTTTTLTSLWRSNQRAASASSRSVR